MPSENFFNLDFWQKFVTTLAGVSFGIPAALLIHRMLGSGKARKERNELIQAVGEALRKNAGLVQQLEEECTKQPREWVPSYALDLTILDATAARKYELFDLVSARLIDGARFELSHLDDKLHILREAAAQLHFTRFDQCAYSWLDTVKGSAKVHLPTVKQAIEDALRDLPAKTDAWWTRLGRWWWSESPGEKH